MNAVRPNGMRWACEVPPEERARPIDAQLQEAKAQERRLIERAQQGDHDAFAALLQLHQRKVFSLIGHLVRPRAEVEDIAQQVFLKAYRALGRFNFRAAFSTWLHRIAVNECYDYLRRQRAKKSSAANEIQVGELAELDRLAAARPAPADSARRAELCQVVEKLFQRLPVDDRLLLTLRELEGYSMEEIAGFLRLKENTVKVRLFRARQRLLETHRRLLGGRRTIERGRK